MSTFTPRISSRRAKRKIYNDYIEETGIKHKVVKSDKSPKLEQDEPNNGEESFAETESTTSNGNGVDNNQNVKIIPKRSDESRARPVKKIKETPKVERLYICRKSGCGKQIKKCCVKANGACCEATGFSSRWYHLSLEEHYCNACFEQFYRNKYDGFEEYHDWRRAWSSNSKSDSSCKTVANYMAEKQLSYWVKCTKCENWRQLGNDIEVTLEIITSYTCAMGNMVNTLKNEINNTPQRTPHIKYSCSEPNDPSVDRVLDPEEHWIANLNYVPFLKFSPAAPYLTSYYPDGVGMSAVDTERKKGPSEGNGEPVVPTKKEPEAPKDTTEKQKDTKAKTVTETKLLMSPGGRKVVKQPQSETGGMKGYFHPFYKPFERGKALCMRPDVMELDEGKEFQEFVKDQTIYLGLRNLIIALWTNDQKSFLSLKKCADNVLLRGLSRIYLCDVLLPKIMNFVTYKGMINCGVLHIPQGGGLLPKKYSDKEVIVIGAGPAGLGGARQLHNFGMKVTVLEARDRLGGRVHDEWSLGGVCVGRGAQIINGCINNPMAMMSHQLGLEMQVLRPLCDLYDNNGNPVSSYCDKRMDFHFNALLDIIADWRRSQQGNCDSSLGEKINEAHTEWIKQSGLTFSQIEEDLLQFHIGNLEFACGTSLNKVSAFHWDQNETFAQFNGDHTLLQYGFGTLLKALAEDLDIKYSSAVSSIEYSDCFKKVKVKTRSGDVYKADCALITIPLAVLKSHMINFVPELPAFKQEALTRIGCGCIEKIGLEFSERFWDEKINGANYFGYVPADRNKKGFFTMFYDIPTKDLKKSNVLMSVISGDSVDTAARMTEEEIVQVAMTILRSIFDDRTIPEPTRHFVTKWKTDPFAMMAYSYIKTGSSGEDYDKLAQSIGNKLYFAGEGTNRHFPQTVTGAYLSGLREAAKIAVMEPPNPHPDP